jgi:TetR/AcrR family transcriptional regulator, cholesterol catabolism regulator
MTLKRPMTPGSRTPRRAPTPSHIDKLETIKVLAAEQFYVLGYAATDLRTIAASAGMHVTSLYNYFSSKEELLYLIMHDGMEGISQSLDEATDGIEEPLEWLQRALAANLLHHTRRRHLAWISHVEVRSLTGEYLEDIIRLRRRYEGRWISTIQDGIKAGVINDVDPRIAAYGLLAIGHSVARWYAEDGSMSAEDLSDELATLMILGVRRAD